MSPFRRHDTDPPAVVGHRGAPLVAAENTPASFRAAAAAGASWVELDVRVAGDGVLVVHHDPATADAVPVAGQTAAGLRDRGVWSLQAVLEELDPAVGVDVEIKNLPGQPDYDEDHGAVDRLAELLDTLPAEGGRERPLLVSCFNPLTVAAAVERLPDVPAGLLHASTLPLEVAADAAADLGARVVCSHLDAPGLDASGIGQAHERGLAVLVWTVDDLAHARELARAGVDAICTNDPAGVVAAVG